MKLVVKTFVGGLLFIGFSCAKRTTAPSLSKESLNVRSLEATRYEPNSNYFSECNQILVKDLFSAYQEGAFGIETTNALKTWLCSEGAKELESGTDLAIDILRSLGAMEAKASWQHDNCSAGDLEFTKQKSDFSLMQHAGSKGFASWSQCMMDRQVSQDKAVCATRKIDEDLIITINYQGQSGALVSAEITNLILAGPMLEDLSYAQTELKYNFEDPEMGAAFTLRARDSGTLICNLEIPVSNKFEASDCEKFRLDSLNQGLISESDYQFFVTANYVPYFFDRKLKGYLTCF